MSKKIIPQTIEISCDRCREIIVEKSGTHGMKTSLNGTQEFFEADGYKGSNSITLDFCTKCSNDFQIFLKGDNK